jgi:hypothetical protein
MLAAALSRMKGSQHNYAELGARTQAKFAIFNSYLAIDF